jgi:nitrite reductase (NADH) large subunit
MTRYVIIGTGVAGIAAAQAIRGRDRSGEIVMVGDDPHGFYSRPGLAYLLTDEIPEKQLYVFSQADWKALGIRFINAQATRLVPQQHRLELDKAGALTYDHLLLATGAQAARLRVPGAGLQGVVKLDHFEDARQILALARRAHSAVVVGGGITSLELAEGLAARKVKVHYFMRGDRYWSNVLDEVESRLVEARLEHEGIRLHFHTELAEVLGKHDRVTGVRTTAGEIVACQMVAVAVGVLPRLELAREAGLEIGRGILVDENLQTSISDIYAAGDVAQVYDPMTGQAVLDSLWGPARAQGYQAGWNMSGSSKAYRKPAAYNVTRLVGVMTTIIGSVGGGRDDDLLAIARGDSETWRSLPNAIAKEFDENINHLRLLVGERTLVGALLMGDQKLSIPLQELISGQVEITPIRQALLQPGAPLGRLVLDFWTEHKQGDKEHGTHKP